MELIRGKRNLRPEHKGCVATIGNFDGVHLGHQAVFAALHERAEALGLPSTVMLFEPQPLEYFRPEQAPSRLTRLREKLEVLGTLALDRVLVLEFGPELAQMPAPKFVEDLLVSQLGIHHLYVGDDFRFGHQRAGDFTLLQRMGAVHGFGVESLQTVAHAGSRISSTRIRRALDQGDLATAAACLGRPYSLCGRVCHGDKRGRTIGYPTLNVHLRRSQSPLHGVFAVLVHGLDGQALPGVANIGVRPTVGDGRYVLEVHLFDFDREVYGAHIRVQFVAFIRDEMKFESFAELSRQIHADAARARQLLGVDPEPAALSLQE
jgi:riboflavin kinase/FMN adenylyltransferase